MCQADCWPPINTNRIAVPALRADQVKDYLRARAREVKLPNATIRTLNEALVAKADYQEAAEEE